MEKAEKVVISLISDAILDFIFTPLLTLFTDVLGTRLSNVNLTIPADAYDGIINSISYACYLFPIRPCLVYLALFWTIDNISIFIALYKFIKSHIPFISGG